MRRLGTDEERVRERYDAIVIGAGVSGLCAALTLQRRGWRVLILERQAQVGGLCGSWEHQGHRYPIACSDFGSGIVGVLRSLGLELEFVRARARFVTEQQHFELPPGGRDLAALLPAVPDLWRLWTSLRAPAGNQTLGDLIDTQVQHGRLAEQLGALSYAFGLPPHSIPLGALKQEFAAAQRYGYQQPLAVRGGIDRVPRALASAFQQAGGVLRRGQNVRLLERDKGDHVALTSDDEFVGRALLSSQGRWRDHPAELRPGLCAGLIHLALDPGRAPFPERVHTLTHCPSQPETWLGALSNGELPEAFGFHISRSEQPLQHGLATVKLAFLMPRGLHAPGTRDSESIVQRIFSDCEALIPGFGAGLRHWHFVSPHEFEQRHLRSSRIAAFEPTGLIQKPAAFDPVSGVYHLGNSVGPPGDHMGAAIAASLAASDSCDRELQRTQPRS